MYFSVLFVVLATTFAAICGTWRNHRDKRLAESAKPKKTPLFA
jgi:hypothetical protein